MGENIIYDIINCNYENDKIEYANILHFRYDECPQNLLVSVSDEIKVHKDLKFAFDKMQAKAKDDGVNIFIFSGFRSFAEQKLIFPKKFTDKSNPSEEEFIARLKFSAPSKFSEHHTGLAVDINTVEDDFAFTNEYQWLRENAPKFGFENSFPENNKQGLGFEPWHWRFVGVDDAKNIFARAESLL